MRDKITFDDFQAAYISAAQFTLDPHPLPGEYTSDFSIIPDYVFNKMKADCDSFRSKLGPLEDIVNSDPGQAGHDFWMTREGHGCGFWVGDWPEPQASQLTTLAKSFGEAYLYPGDLGFEEKEEQEAD